MDTGREFAYAEVLGQLIVGSDIETEDAVHLFAPLSEHDQLLCCQFERIITNDW